MGEDNRHWTRLSPQQMGRFHSWPSCAVCLSFWVRIWLKHINPVRWDPNRENDDFFNQSVSLFTSFYHVQILIHRPFIPSPSKPSALEVPSLAICTNAARVCSHIVDIQGKRNPMPPPQILVRTFQLQYRNNRLILFSFFKKRWRYLPVRLFFCSACGEGSDPGSRRTITPGWRMCRSVWRC